MNQIELVGTLFEDFQLRCTTDGTPFANGRLATKVESTGADGTEREQIQLYNIVLRGDTALCAEALTRGMRLEVEGKRVYHGFERDGVTPRVAYVEALSITATRHIGAAGREAAIA